MTADIETRAYRRVPMLRLIAAMRNRGMPQLKLTYTLFDTPHVPRSGIRRLLLRANSSHVWCLVENQIYVYGASRFAVCGRTVDKFAVVTSLYGGFWRISDPEFVSDDPAAVLEYACMRTLDAVMEVCRHVC